MRIAVFLGSKFGVGDAYRDAAAGLGRAIANAGHGLVYGGGSVGLMGVVASAALSQGGEVTGVIPRLLSSREMPSEGLTELHVVETMHDRKAMMAELSDGFITLPGGLGTLEELFEIWTWAQLGYHRKPLGLLNVGGFFDGLIRFIDYAQAEGFLSPGDRDLLKVSDDPATLIGWIEEEVARRGASPMIDTDRL